MSAWELLGWIVAVCLIILVLLAASAIAIAIVLAVIHQFTDLRKTPKEPR